MKNLILYSILIFTFLSCSEEIKDTECEDYFEANQEIINGIWSWFPYENGDHKVDFISNDDTVLENTIRREELVQGDVIGPIFKCPEVSVSPKVTFFSPNGNDIFEMWAKDVNFENKKSQATFVFKASKDGALFSFFVPDMNNFGTTLDLGGKSYDKSIKVTFNDEYGVEKIGIYLQYQNGIIGTYWNQTLYLLK